jgi:hypothetical protein
VQDEDVTEVKPLKKKRGPHGCRPRPFLITKDGEEAVLFPSIIKAATFLGITTKVLVKRVAAGTTRFRDMYTVVYATKAGIEEGSAQA